MAFKKTNKTGQAAIEFLMTYGWMLLVVLIVGALIFSFVDFGGLLPNTVTFSSASIEPIVGDSFASGDSALGTDNEVLVAFRYNGAQPIEFDFTTDVKFNLSYNFGDDSCSTVAGTLPNVIINNNDISSGLIDSIDNADTNKVRFRNGHAGYIHFTNCPGFDEVDNVEGTILITYTSIQTGAESKVTGDVRLSKQ